MTPAYFTLGDIVAPPPLPALLALLMVLGFKYLGSLLSLLFCGDKRGTLETAACFILAIGLVGAGLQIMGVAWRFPLLLLKVIAWSLAALGFMELRRVFCGPLLPVLRKCIFSSSAEFHRWERAVSVVSAVTLLLLCLMALGPPTDADSLDYHLGVPLEFLRRGEPYPRFDWFNARLIGSGELLNMLGLAGGTDALGAALSGAGLVALAMGLVAVVDGERDKVFLRSLLLGCPFLLFLVPNQKPFLLPVAATTIALIVITKRFGSLDGRSPCLAFGCAFFAMSCKYSFLLSGAVVLLVGFVSAHRSGKLGAAAGIAVLLYGLFLFPAHAQKLLFYGDPISPMLEQFNAEPDPGLKAFASYVRHYSVSQFPFPLSIIVPDTFGAVSSVFGLGSLVLIVALSKAGSSWTLAGAAALTSAVLFIAGARSAGYFFEPYVWLSLAAAHAAWGWRKLLLARLMLAQGVLMILMAAYGAATLFPGAITGGLREGVMKRSAHEYTVMVWLDRALPADTMILSTLRSHALMPRPFMSKDIVTWTDWASPIHAKKTVGFLEKARINTLVAEPFVAEEIADKLCMDILERVAGPERFAASTRNPWNRGVEYDLAVFRVRFRGELPGIGR